MAWDPKRYILGNYFQTKINEQFRNTFCVQPFGEILDVGCGDGQYTYFLANLYKHSRILGIDNSVEMIHHARQLWTRKNLSFAVQRIEDFQQFDAFDFVLSFWCLHWTKIEEAFPNIFQALKINGYFYAVFSSFSDHSILQIWHELARNGRYCELARNNIQDLQPYINYFYHVLKVTTHIPFRRIRMDLHTLKVELPNIDYLKNLIMALPFMKGIPEATQEDLVANMLDAFQHICQRKYEGRLYYETRPIFLEAMK